MSMTLDVLTVLSVQMDGVGIEGQGTVAEQELCVWAESVMKVWLVLRLQHLSRFFGGGNRLSRFFGSSLTHEDNVATFDDVGRTKVDVRGHPQSLSNVVLQSEYLVFPTIGVCHGLFLVWTQGGQATFNADKDLLITRLALDGDVSNALNTHSTAVVHQERIVRVEQNTAASPHTADEGVTRRMVGICTIGQQV